MYFFLLSGQIRKEDGNCRGLAKDHMEMELDLGLSESHTSPPSVCVVSPAWDFLSSRETKKQGGREEKLFGANKVTSRVCG